MGICSIYQDQGRYNHGGIFMDNKDDKMSAGYKIGYITGAVILMCLNALLVAATVKLICWMF